MSQGPFIDPLDALARCEQIAREAVRDLQAGRAVSGSSALVKIEKAAEDARRWAPPSASGATIGAVS